MPAGSLALCDVYMTPLWYYVGLKHSGISWQVACNSGYRSGSTDRAAPSSYQLTCSRGCQELGSDAVLSALCTPVVCPRMPLPAHARLVDGAEAAKGGAAMLPALQHLAQVLVQCELGYKVNMTACDTRFAVTCSDGHLQGMRSCVPIQCGCGSASCNGFQQAHDIHAQAWHPQNAVQHGTEITVTCAVGHRASSGSVADCTASTTYQVACDDCEIKSYLSCQPVSCGRFEDWPTYDSNMVQSVQYFEDGRAAAVSHASYLTQAMVTCKEGFRARPFRSLRVPLRSDPQFFTVTCKENCAFSPKFECARLECPLFSPGHGTVVGGAADLIGLSSFQINHTQHVLIQCDPGYKMSVKLSQNSSACLRSLVAWCHLGSIVTQNAAEDGGVGPISIDSAHDYQASCVPIDCQAGDDCGQGSGGVCTPSELKSLDPLSVPPDLYYGGSLRVYCAQGSAAVHRSEISASCDDPSSYSYSCSDCVWRAGNDLACKQQMCNAIEASGVQTAIPVAHPQGDAYPATSAWPPRAYTGQTLTIVCQQGFRAAAPHAPPPDMLAPMEFNVTCVQGCLYRDLKACAPLSCGRFNKGLGMQVLLLCC